MTWSQFFETYREPLIDATWVTLKLAFVSFGIALVVGVIIVSFRVSPVPPLVKFATWFVSVFRNIPLLVICFLALFGLGDLNLVFDYFPTAAVALGLDYWVGLPGREVARCARLVPPAPPSSAAALLCANSRDRRDLHGVGRRQGQMCKRDRPTAPAKATPKARHGSDGEWLMGPPDLTVDVVCLCLPVNETIVKSLRGCPERHVLSRRVGWVRVEG